MPRLPLASPYAPALVNSVYPLAMSAIMTNAPNVLQSDTFQRLRPQPAAPVSRLPLNQTDARRRFVVLGDAGTGDQNQANIAGAMERTFLQKPFASVLVMGDNVYPKGEPERFEKCIYRPYEPLFKTGVRFYPVLGNHDVKQPDLGAGQLRYWGVPRYYNQRIGDNIEIFALDTTLLLPKYDHCYDKNPEAAAQAGSQELMWLREKLAQSTARFKIVYGHYPLYSVSPGHYPQSTQARLRGLLEPLMMQYGVDAYLAGHDHDYEKAAPMNGRPQYLVSGAGGRLRDDEKEGLTPVWPIEKLISQRHFMLFEERPDGLSYQVLSKEGLEGPPLDSGLIRAKTRPALPQA